MQKQTEISWLFANISESPVIHGIVFVQSDVGWGGFWASCSLFVCCLLTKARQPCYFCMPATFQSLLQLGLLWTCVLVPGNKKECVKSLRQVSDTAALSSWPKATEQSCLQTPTPTQRHFSRQVTGRVELVHTAQKKVKYVFLLKAESRPLKESWPGL